MLISQKGEKKRKRKEKMRLKKLTPQPSLDFPITHPHFASSLQVWNHHHSLLCNKKMSAVFSCIPPPFSQIPKCSNLSHCLPKLPPKFLHSTFPLKRPFSSLSPRASGIALRPLLRLETHLGFVVFFPRIVHILININFVHKLFDEIRVRS